MKAWSIIILKSFAALMVASALTPLTQAQRGGPARRSDPVTREQQRQFELQMIEAKLDRRMGNSDVRKQPLVLGHIKEDFLSIQVIDRRLREASAGKRDLTFKFIEESVSEIRKRAIRLKTNLALPESEEILAKPKVEPATEPDQLRPSLSILSNWIYEFVSNPMFISAKVVDTRLSTKARQDLEQIIEMCSELKRSSEKLKAATRRGP